jgi:hypothetical protein
MTEGQDGLNWSLHGQGVVERDLQAGRVDAGGGLFGGQELQPNTGRRQQLVK